MFSRHRIVGVYEISFFAYGGGVVSLYLYVDITLHSRGDLVSHQVRVTLAFPD
jgi:hypothetical protein